MFVGMWRGRYAKEGLLRTWDFLFLRNCYGNTVGETFSLKSPLYDRTAERTSESESCCCWLKEEMCWIDSKLSVERSSFEKLCQL